MGLTLRHVWVARRDEWGELGFRQFPEGLRDFIEMHADLPDLWTSPMAPGRIGSGPSRFKEEGPRQFELRDWHQGADHAARGGPWGRFTSPDVMVKQLTSGTLD